MNESAALADVVRRTLDERELEYEEAQPGAFLVKLPGAHKLATMTWLVVGDHSLHIEAFFCRKPDENEAASTAGCSNATRGCSRCRSRSTTSATST